MIIHPHIPKRKAKKPNAQQRALAANWQEILRKYDVKPSKPNTKTTISRPYVSRPIRAGSSTSHIPSLDSGLGMTPKKSSAEYTGDAMIGISVLHKSNGVPVFRQEDVLDIGKMRRG
jgi:hypothetical protein